MEYKVVRSETGGLFDKTDPQKRFEEKINKLIQEGWKPQGGVWSSSTAGGYMQAMVREEQL